MTPTIGDLFDIVYGQREYHNKEWLDGNDGNNILISSKGEDNGIYGFYDIEAKFKAPFITVQGYGTIGHAFVQERDCSVDDHMLILLPKKKLTNDELYQVAFQIRLTKWRYRYGRGITPDRLKTQAIILNSTSSISSRMEKELMPKPIEKRSLPVPEEIKVFKLKDLFEVQKGEGSYLEKMEEGDVPVVSTTVSNTGVVGFYDIEPVFKAGTITIGRIMCNPSIQLRDYSTVPDDMFVLKPLTSVDETFLIYIAAVIKKEGWRFNYSRKVTKKKLEQLDIPVPMKGSEIDCDYIRQTSQNSYGYKELVSQI